MEERARVARPVSYWIGWCVLAVVASQLPLIVAGFKTLNISPGLAEVLLAQSLPVSLILLAGGAGLIGQNGLGFFLVAGATFFGAMGGFKTPYIPFFKKAVPAGPYQDDVFLAANLVIVAILAWEHFSVLRKTGAPKGQRILAGVFMAAGLAWVGVGRSMLEKTSGEAAKMADLPVIGDSLAAVEAKGPVRFISVHERSRDGQTLVLAGECTEDSVVKFALQHDLGKLPNGGGEKFLNLVKSWDLEEKGYRTDFKDGDLILLGRLKDRPKVVVQLGFRPKDGSFTAQAMGIVEKR